MKKHYLAALAVTAMLGLGASGTALAAGNAAYLDGSGIVGSPHDFTDDVIFGAAGTVATTDPITGVVTTTGIVVANSEQWNFRKEICRVCHAPHDKQRTAYQAGLLWNRNLSTATYDTYVMSEKRAPGKIGEPQGRAKMCLSCHDNTVALSQFDNYADGGVDPEDSTKTAANETKTGGDGAKTMQDIYADGHFMIGGKDGANGNLKGTHPISVPFATGYMLNPDTTPMGPFSGTIANVLDNGMVQCSSCHDVHNRVSVPGTHLLRVAQSVKDGGTPSGLCLTCHKK